MPATLLHEVVLRSYLSTFGTVEPSARRLDNLEIPVRHEVSSKGAPQIFVSYAWGDDSTDDARKRGEVVERMSKRWKGTDGKLCTTKPPCATAI